MAAAVAQAAKAARASALYITAAGRSVFQRRVVPKKANVTR